MSSIATAVFEATIGLLINKARDTAAEKLKEGDVTDQKFRSLIVREIDQINSKLDGLARKDLLSSMSAFKEGIAILFDVFNKANREWKELAAAEGTAAMAEAGSAHAKTVSLAKKLGELQLIDLDESSKELLSDAKERFKEARSKARDAFSNEGLSTSDRILAAMVRVMSTILEKVDNPANALTPCRVCLEELHALPAVKKSFNVALAEGFKSWFGTDERKEIIAAVCGINHAIFDVTHMVGSDSLIWPLIDVGAEKVHPLRDLRVAAEINKQNTQYIGYYPLQWSFGGDVLKLASCICTNTKDQFIVGDDEDCNIKVFDSDGKFLYSLSYAFKDSKINRGVIRDVATDQADNVYALVGSVEMDQFEVCIFDKDGNEHGRFAVDGLRASRLTVVEEKSRQVFVVGAPLQEPPDFVVNVYENDGTFLRSLVGVQPGHRVQFQTVISWGAGCRVKAITACNGGRVMVLYGSSVHVFSAEGDCLDQFSVGLDTRERAVATGSSFLPPRLPVAEVNKILWANEHIIVVSQTNSSFHSFCHEIVVAIYTEDGELVCHYPIHSALSFTGRISGLSGITMNRQGRIALALFVNFLHRVLVF